MPPQVKQEQSIPRLDLPALLCKLHTEHMRRESNYCRLVKTRTSRLKAKHKAQECKAHVGSCQNDAKLEINTRVISWVGEEKFYAFSPWHYAIEKLRGAFDVNPGDGDEFAPSFEDQLIDHCRIVLHGGLALREPTKFSAWVVRLDKANFADDLLVGLWDLYPRECERLVLPTPAGRTEEAAGGTKVTPAVDQIEPPDQSSTPANLPDRYTFRPEGDGWLVEFGEERGHFRDFKGFSMVHKLLSSPKKPIAVSILGGQQSDGAAKRPVTDREYRADVRRKLGEYDDDIAKAEASNDSTTGDVLRREKQAIVAQLAADSGLRGKSRTFKDDSERIRNRVSKQINNVSERLRECNSPLPKLAVHLMRSIIPQSGYYTYQPEQHISWNLG